MTANVSILGQCSWFSLEDPLSKTPHPAPPHHGFQVKAFETGLDLQSLCSVAIVFLAGECNDYMSDNGFGAGLEDTGTGGLVSNANSKHSRRDSNPQSPP